MSTRVNKEDEIKICYLCNKKLTAPLSPDHIIPDKLFRKNSPYRPQLPVHNICNNSKSKEDEWFIKQLQLRCSFNPEAEKEFSKMIEKAVSEKPDAYLVGKDVRNYKFARGVFDQIIWGMELKHKGQSLMQMKISNKDVIRFQRYIEVMCRGLFILNVPHSNPAIPQIIQKQYAYLELKGQDKGFIENIQRIIDMSRTTKFGQYWDNKIFYIGSRVNETPHKGFIFVQFYSQFGVLAFFR